MRVLILSASIGSGHTKAAEAIGENFSGQAEIIDFMSREISGLNWLTKKIYLAALNLIPDLYDRIYNFAGVRQVGPFTRLLSSASMYLPFARLVENFSPDVIICTHPFPEAAASLWKFLHAKSKKNFLLAAVLTDYSLHGIWIYSEVDVYFVATEEMKRELAAQSRSNQEIYSLGIPISSTFAEEKFPEQNVCKKILIMGGGLGLGSIEETLPEIDSLETSLKISVVAGQNEKLLSRIKKMQKNFRHEVEVLGYVENISELMRSSDLLITKPGALTMTEAFAVGLPMLLHSPIPGPEAKNAEFAISNGAAISVGENKISSVVKEIFSDATKLEVMKAKAKKLGKIDAAKKISERIEKIFTRQENL